MKLKLGQVFWMRDWDKHIGVQGRSDYECRVVGTKICKFIDGTGFTDYLIDKTRLNDYHISFKAKKDRTNRETLRYDHDTKELKYWFSIHWPKTVEKWKPVEDKIFKKKPRDLRGGP